MRFLLLLIFAVSLVFLPAIVLAKAETGECETSGATGMVDSDEAGVFMANVCTECWEKGDCSLNDILTVVANFGNFVLSIVAALVFFVYILGGFWWIASHGDPGWVTKGRTYIKNATFGLIIVLVAYTGVVALRSAITKGELSGGYVLCAGEDTDDFPCALNSRCSGFSCVSNCQDDYDGSCLDLDSAEIFVDNAFDADEAATCVDGVSLCPTETQRCCYYVGE